MAIAIPYSYITQYPSTYNKSLMYLAEQTSLANYIYYALWDADLLFTAPD